MIRDSMKKRLFHAVKIGCCVCILLSICTGLRFCPRTHIYDRVFLIGIDGAGTFLQNDDIDSFWDIFEENNVTFSMEAVYPSLSAPNWGSMFYGVAPEEHALTNKTVVEQKMMNPQLSSVFKIVHEYYPEASIGSIAAWSPINYGIIDGFEGMYLYPDILLKSSLPNDEVVEATKEYLEKNDPKLLYIHFDEVDHAGHAYGWGSKEYNEALIDTMEDVKEIYRMLESKNFLENSLFILTADHGGTEKKHGGDRKEEMETFFAISGEGLNDKVQIGDMKITDIPTIVLYALGIEKAEYMQGTVPDGLFVHTR